MRINLSRFEGFVPQGFLKPNSSNLQTWEFYRIRSKDKIRELMPLGLNQNAFRTASELVLFVSRKDLWPIRCNWPLENIKVQLSQGSTNENRLKKGLRYYGRVIPFLYCSDPFGIYNLIRSMNITYRDLNGKPMLRRIAAADTQVVSHKSLALASGRQARANFRMFSLKSNVSSNFDNTTTGHSA